VQFLLEGVAAGAPVKLGPKGAASWTAGDLKPGTHHVSASYTPERESSWLPSASTDELHTVIGGSAVIPNLPMQGGDETTPCPRLDAPLTRADAASIPYLRAVLPGLDKQCTLKGAGFVATFVRFTKCASDPRGKGFGPNATADVTCGSEK
jgi:hypothetical protein